MRHWSFIVAAASSCVCCVLPAYEPTPAGSGGSASGNGGTKMTSGGRPGEPIGGEADGGTPSVEGGGKTGGSESGGHTSGGGGNTSGGGAAGASSGGATGGGNNGGGGASAGTGATAGAGGSGGESGCVAPSAATGVISTFDTMNIANQLSGGTDEAWVASPGNSNFASVSSGALKVKQTSGSWGAVSAIVSKGVKCLDLTGKYKGIQFKISSPINTSIQFFVSTPETLVDFSHFSKNITVSATPTTNSILFSSLNKASWGAGMALPADYNPQQHLVGLGFGVLVEMENLDITLDDVSFY